MGQVDPVLQRVIARAISAAHAFGRDMNGQSQAAVAAVLIVRPDMTALEATRAVYRLGMTSAGNIPQRPANGRAARATPFVG